jgi:hypothetical protein
MNNLLTIEQALLSNEAVANGLNLTAIKSALKAEGNAQKQKFNKTLALSKLAVEALAWFKTDDAKAIFAANGVAWTTEDFAGKVFGVGKVALGSLAILLELDAVAVILAVLSQQNQRGRIRRLHRQNECEQREVQGAWVELR